MSEPNQQNQDKLIETLFIPLCIRALESQRPDALLKDETAVKVVARYVQEHGEDFVEQKLADVEDYSRVAVILRILEIDRRTREYLAIHPQAVVIQIGCGLDARFERVDNGQVEWFDLDLPEVIDLRKEYYRQEEGRYHLLPYSVFEPAWLTIVDGFQPRPTLILAESVFIYFEEQQVKSLVLALQDHFPGCELIFEAFSPSFIWANNLRVDRTGVGTYAHWGLKRGKDLETWGDNIRLLSEWFPFRVHEPRLGKIRYVQFLPFFMKTMGVYHVRLGKREEIA